MTALLTTRQAAERLHKSKSWLDRKRAHGGGPVYVRLDGEVFYLPSDVDDFIVKSRVTPGDREWDSTSGASTQESSTQDASTPGGTASRSARPSSGRRRARQIAEELRAASVRQDPTKKPSLHVVAGSKE